MDKERHKEKIINFERKYFYNLENSLDITVNEVLKLYNGLLN